MSSLSLTPRGIVRCRKSIDRFIRPVRSGRGYALERALADQPGSTTPRLPGGGEAMEKSVSFDVRVAVDDDVARLDVFVDDVPLMDRPERVRELGAILTACARPTPCPLPSIDRPQRAAGEVFHDERGAIEPDLELVDPDDPIEVEVLVISYWRFRIATLRVPLTPFRATLMTHICAVVFSGRGIRCCEPRRATSRATRDSAAPPWRPPWKCPGYLPSAAFSGVSVRVNMRVPVSRQLLGALGLKDGDKRARDPPRERTCSARRIAISNRK